MNVAVMGLWHLGSVTAAALARLGHHVVGWDPNEEVVADLNQGIAPIAEPGLNESLQNGLRVGRLRFVASAKEACGNAKVICITLDTPVDDEDRPDVDSVRRTLDAVLPFAPEGTLVLISSQVPVGFTAQMEETFRSQRIHFAYSPENLRLGQALEVFLNPDRIVVGVRHEPDRVLLSEFFGELASRIEWMSIESAEMTKHAVNAFLATSVAFINELARLCELVGADAGEVARGLKTESRIGPRAYLSPGRAFAGGTLARDLRALLACGNVLDVPMPLCEGVVHSNTLHVEWLRHQIKRALGQNHSAQVSLLGLTYKAGTNTLRRSGAVAIAGWLSDLGHTVRAFDPAISRKPEEMAANWQLASSMIECLEGSDLAVVMTNWPEFRSLKPADVRTAMKSATLIDPDGWLGAEFRSHEGIRYFATGRVAA